MIKEYNRNMHAMSDFEDLSISSSNESIQSIISNTSNEDQTTTVASQPTRSEAMGKNEKGIILRIIRI
eukprot:1628198-Ditylum_brightwellii.AAC.1